MDGFFKRLASSFRVRCWQNAGALLPYFCARAPGTTPLMDTSAFGKAQAFTGTDSPKIFSLPTTSFLKAYGSTIAIDGGSNTDPLATIQPGSLEEATASGLSAEQARV